MKEITIEQRSQEIITDIKCDSCGESCMKYESTVDNPVRLDHGHKFRSFECMRLHSHWGYGSRKDCEEWEAFICEKCVDEKFGFIKFKKSEYDGFTGRTKGEIPE